MHWQIRQLTDSLGKANLELDAARREQQTKAAFSLECHVLTIVA